MYQKESKREKEKRPITGLDPSISPHTLTKILKVMHRLESEKNLDVQLSLYSIKFPSMRNFYLT